MREKAILLERTYKMATGDIKNNLRKLMVELKQVRYPVTEVDLKGLAQGTPRSFLPILHYIFLNYSVDLTEFFVKDYELYGKTDLRFVEIVYKMLRDVFHYKPSLTREQFLSIGYAERKIIELCDILKRCREKSSELNPKTSKIEKKHPNSKMKNRSIEVGKEFGSQFSTFSQKGGQKLRHSSQNEVQKSKERFDENENGKNRIEENKENNSNYSQFHSQVSNKPATSMRNTQSLEQRGVLKSRIKCVRWEEEEEERSSTVNANGMKSLLPSTALAEINGNNQTSNMSAFPNVMSTSMKAPPKCIPTPVTMTTIPKPSPELTLTPIGKIRHQPIPLSGSRHDCGEDVTNVSLIDLTDSIEVQQPMIVRHEYGGQIESRSSDVMANQMNLSTLSQDNELKVLKGIIGELQEKLDSVLLQNNEMSARVVLLESRVNLLEEASSRNQGGNFIDTNYSLPDHNVNTNPFHTNIPVFYAPASDVRKETVVNSGVMTCPDMVRQSDYVPYSTASSSRNLINAEFNHGKNSYAVQSNNKYVSERYVHQASHHIEVPQVSTVTEVSDDDTSTVNKSAISPSGSPMSHTAYKSTGRSIEAISPFSTTQEIHLKFSDPSTTATIINVERRLKETREMLANAAKFAGTSLP
jgi:centrosomal protein CEP44